KKVKFEMRDKPWSQVFEWLSDQTGLPVMWSNDNKLTGTFTFIPPGNGRKEYTIPQVIDILNQSLEQQRHLLLRRGANFFVVSTVIPNPRGLGGFRLNEKWTDGLFEEKSWDVGTAHRGEQLVGHHAFRLTNNLDKPIHVAAIRSSAAYLTPRL